MNLKIGLIGSGRAGMIHARNFISSVPHGRLVVVCDAVEEAAKAAAALNGLDNCRFIAGDCFEVLDSIDDKPEVIVVDPPRVGIKTDALDKIIGYGVDQIVYVSCNPKSLADNLYYMQYYGYEVKSVKPFDNFPGTKHTECVCLLSRKG